MNLLNALLARATNPARFGLITIPIGNNAIVVPLNELARDLLGEYCSTTRSIIADDAALATLKRASGQAHYGHCGMTVTHQPMPFLLDPN